jgi:hypothetical protein
VMDKIVSAFCEQPNRKALYDYVATRTAITFERNTASGWGSKTENGNTIIYWSDTAHPEACLCHELLHAKLKIDGYQQYVQTQCRTVESSRILRLLGALDNELPHHAFYPQFATLGFAPEEMYEDNDKDTYRFIKDEIALLKGKDSAIEDYFYLLISTIAPGGCMSDQQRSELLGLLEAKAPRRFWKRLVTIQEVFAAFAASGSLDAGPIIVQVLTALGNYDPTWISTPLGKFPDDGLFVGTPFS